MRAEPVSKDSSSICRLQKDTGKVPALTIFSISLLRQGAIRIPGNNWHHMGTCLNFLLIGTVAEVFSPD